MIKFNAKDIRIYRDNYYNIKKYNDDYYKLTYCKVPIRKSGYELDSDKDYKRDKNEFKLDNNKSRARTRVFEIAMCNDWEYFITLTLSGKKYDRYNLPLFIKDFGQFIRDYRKKYKANIQYLLIPEKHEDEAWHMHGLIKNIPYEHLHINKNGYLDWKAYKNKFGWVSLGKVQDKVAISKYITKYISKDIDNTVNEKNKKLYYCTRGLRRSERIKEGTLSIREIEKIAFSYENDYVKTLELSKQEFHELLTLFDKS